MFSVYPWFDFRFNFDPKRLVGVQLDWVILSQPVSNSISNLIEQVKMK